MKKKIFDQVVDELWKNRIWYWYYDEDYIFDYPDYGNLPKKLSRTFSSEVVDAIQDIWWKLCMPVPKITKAKFKKDLRVTIECLGEKIK